MKFCLLYQIFCYISSVQTIQNKVINFIGTGEKVCYIRYFVISDLSISSFHCTVLKNIEKDEFRS